VQRSTYQTLLCPYQRRDKLKKALQDRLALPGLECTTWPTMTSKTTPVSINADTIMMFGLYSDSGFPLVMIFSIH
jgi:hypothetical protein